jgi:hypothetical protein
MLLSVSVSGRNKLRLNFGPAAFGDEATGVGEPQPKPPPPQPQLVPMKAIPKPSSVTQMY